MLADASGHGLAPAISVMPVLSMFYSLIESSVQVPDLQSLVGEINRQLIATLPRGRFVAAAVMCIDERQQQADLWVGGVPALFWLGTDGRVKRCFASTHLSLGIVETDADLLSFEHVNWQVGDRFIVCSDGLLESQLLSGETLGVDRFAVLLEESAPEDDLLTHVLSRLTSQLATSMPSDDMSLLMVECRAAP
jgi:serine phosphatase RsbU (regulator of sigma subunit)